MQAKIAVERIFSLGDFKNIKFTEEITEIPEEVLLNPEAMGHLRYIQLLDIDRQFNVYVYNNEAFKGDTTVATIEALEDERTRTFELLLKDLKKE